MTPYPLRACGSKPEKVIFNTFVISITFFLFLCAGDSGTTLLLIAFKQNKRKVQERENGDEDQYYKV